MKSLIKYLTLTASLAAFSLTASAVPTLVLYDWNTATLKVVTDNSGDDINGLNDVLTWSGSLGVWTVNVSTGIITGDDCYPCLDLNTVNMSNVATGNANLSVYLIVDGFGPSLGLGAEANIGGTTQGSVYYSGWQDNNNGAGLAFDFNATNKIIGWNGSFGPGAFSDVDSGALLPPSTLYSLALAVDIQHGSGFKVTSLDYQLCVPDSGMTALLLGLGLLSVGLAARRSKA